MSLKKEPLTCDEVFNHFDELLEEFKIESFFHPEKIALSIGHWRPVIFDLHLSLREQIFSKHAVGSQISGQYHSYAVRYLVRTTLEFEKRGLC